MGWPHTGARMITLEQVELALLKLSETDEEYARAKANIDYIKHQAKVVYETIYLTSNVSGVAGKKAECEVSKDYGDAMRRARDAVYDFEICRAKRLGWQLQIDVWRSINAARSRGIVV